VVVGEQLDRGETLGVVGPHWGKDDEHFCTLSLGDSEVGVSADGCGADVKGVALPLGDPVAIDLDELLDALDELIAVEGWQEEPLAGCVHPRHVHIGAEQADVARLVDVGFHALEALQAVVKRAGSWRDFEVLVRADAGGVPALVRGPVHLQHMVGESFAECQLFLGQLRLGVDGAGHSQ